MYKCSTTSTAATKEIYSILICFKKLSIIHVQSSHVYAPSHTTYYKEITANDNNTNKNDIISVCFVAKLKS